MKPYCRPEDLPRFGAMSEHAPELGRKFFEWYGAVFQDGALTAREKSLIGLAGELPSCTGCRCAM